MLYILINKFKALTGTTNFMDALLMKILSSGPKLTDRLLQKLIKIFFTYRDYFYDRTIQL